MQFNFKSKFLSIGTNHDLPTFLNYKILLPDSFNIMPRTRSNAAKASREPPRKRMRITPPEPHTDFELPEDFLQPQPRVPQPSHEVQSFMGEMSNFMQGINALVSGLQARSAPSTSQGVSQAPLPTTMNDCNSASLQGASQAPRMSSTSVQDSSPTFFPPVVQHNVPNPHVPTGHPGPVNTITGGLPNFSDSSPPARDRNGSLISRARPLHFGVPDRIKEKIWNRQFIDFHLLLPDSRDQRKHTLLLADGDEDPITLSFGSQGKQKPLNLLQWSLAFDTFASIYSLKFPSESNNLIRYSSFIKEIYQEGGDWRFYDESFRKWRQDEHVEWNDTIHILYFKALNRGKPVSTPFNDNKFPNKFRKDQSFRSQEVYPRGSCWKFRKHGKCSFKNSSCEFQHTCSKCEGNHSFLNCFKNSKPAKSFTPKTSTKNHNVSKTSFKN